MTDNKVQDKQKQITDFHAYVDELHEALLSESLFNSILNNNANLHHLLDGRAKTVLSQTVSLTTRREQGIFFTNDALAEKVSSGLSCLLNKGIKVADPACGAGNLLLACASYLPVGSCLEKTIDIWSDLIFGRDLFEEFILATKLRLILLAAIRSRDVKGIKDIVLRMEAFPGLTVCDIVDNDIATEPVDCVVVNPPFGNIHVPDECKWATGTVQKAGLFFERILRSATQGQQIIAILPDVLRSGTRYSKWRKTVSRLASSMTIEIKGRFDEEADVDVFVLSAVAGKGCNTIDWMRFDKSVEQVTKFVSDFFKVHVGPVVPHRDKKEGLEFPYIHARTMPPWETVESIDETRKYSGTVFKPPFVVVHRTSSPRDKYRCVGTIVNTNTEVAVENHLVILLPKDGSLKKCDELLSVLRHGNTNKWMNSRICCRHLTVASVKELPWWS